MSFPIYVRGIFRISPQARYALDGLQNVDTPLADEPLHCFPGPRTLEGFLFLSFSRTDHAQLDGRIFPPCARVRGDVFRSERQCAVR